MHTLGREIWRGKLKKVEYLEMSSAPDLIMGTHVIVGYPGETEVCFDETVKLLEQLPLDFISCFPYSEHAKADSAALRPKVSPQQIRERIDHLVAVFGSKLKAYT